MPKYEICPQCSNTDCWLVAYQVCHDCGFGTRAFDQLIEVNMLKGKKMDDKENARVLEIQKLNKAIDRRNKTIKKWREKHERLKEDKDVMQTIMDEMEEELYGLRYRLQTDV